MDARVGEQSHRRTSIKRPWEDVDDFAGQNDPAFETFRFTGVSGTARFLGNATQSTSLPPIDDIAFRRPSTQRGSELLPGFGNHAFGPDFRNSVFKRSKLEEDDYNAPVRQNVESNSSNSSNSKFTSPQLFNSGYSNDATSRESSIAIKNSTAVSVVRPTESQNSSILCRRCKQPATQEQELGLFDLPGSCDVCRKNPELERVTQAAAAGLTKLAETLRSGILSEQRGIIRTPDQSSSSTSDCPLIIQVGLKDTLNWIFEKINEANCLADDLLRQTAAGNSENLSGESLNDGSNEDGLDIMKRRIDVDPEEASTRLREGVESISDAKVNTRRRSVTAPVVGLQAEHHSPLHHHDGRDPRDPKDNPNYLPDPVRRSFMNPPPAPARSLPSPTGRSFPSPISTNFPSPSPSSSSSGVPQHSLGRLPPPLVHQTTINTYLPPISGAHSPDLALRDHSAALQHEVSIQKIALSSLQGEHDKLLSAFSRSQTRASALEKKYAVSDSEIISLTEEKLRLQQQVIELERDIEELTRSRDETRQAAVQEGAQYVQIVGKATRLEEIAGEERKNWNRLKDDMEKRITALSMGKDGRDAFIDTQVSDVVVTDSRVTEAPRSEILGPSVNLPTEVKIEITSDPARFTPNHSSQAQESTEELKETIQHLRERCKKVEEALNSIRNMGRSLVEHAESTLLD